MTAIYCLACLLVGSWIGRQWERARMDKITRRAIARWSEESVDVMGEGS